MSCCKPDRFVLALCGVLLITPFLSADISLPKIFSDHMVLQRNSDVEIWGTAEPSQKLAISFDGSTQSMQADVDGHWSVTIKTPGAGGPHQLEIAAVKGEPKVIFSDVMVGEVWLCSGQSNMERPVTDALNPETEIENAKNYPNLRLFTVARNASPQPLDEFANVTPWTICSSESVKSFSATAYFFGVNLSDELKGIPIGLIDASWGGTRAEAWTSRASISKIKSLAPLLDYWNENDDPSSQHRPANLYNGMIAPLTRFKIRGVIWYQGEANNGRGHQYATLFPTLIRDWRTAFNNIDLPFYFVQLAPFRYQNSSSIALAEIWDAQLKTLQNVVRTGMVVTTDIGNVSDIHPKNKQEVGRRLALIALAKIYFAELPVEKQDLIFSGPIYDSMSVDQGRVLVMFQHVGQGLKKRDQDQPLDNFQICGEDRNFVPAVATIHGNTVEVTAEEVENPIAVRFAWSDSAEPNLVNSAGLPASPFRTDDFPLESVDRNF